MVELTCLATLAPLPNPPRRGEGTGTSDSNPSFVRGLKCVTTIERLHPGGRDVGDRPRYVRAGHLQLHAQGSPDEHDDQRVVHREEIVC